ncbi:hypothetical protein PG987_012261 [Apiospora arundinis]
MKPYTESSDNTHESFNAAPSGEEEDDAGEDDEANVYSMQVAGSQNGRANWRCLFTPQDSQDTNHSNLGLRYPGR